jgi:hypothetical protein
MKKQDTIWVRNNGTVAFEGRYDSEDFTIAPGEAVEMLVECAVLWFGFGEESKERVLRKLGWAHTHQASLEGEKRLSQFSFHTHEPDPKSKRREARAQARSAAPAGDGQTSGDDAQADSPEEAPESETGGVNLVEKLARAAAAPAG